MWKKRKLIEGVSASTIVDLKGVLYQREQQTVKRPRSAPTEKKLHHILNVEKEQTEFDPSLGSAKNKGVQERSARDEREEEEAKQTYESIEKKLLEKSKLYDQLKAQQIDEGIDGGEYLVDFVRKGWEHPEEVATTKETKDMYTLDSEDEAQHSHDYNDDDSTIGLHHPDIAREEERRRWERETAQRIAEEAAEEERRRQQKELIMVLQNKTKEGRERHKRLKERRERMAQARLEEIRRRKEQRQAEVARNDQN